MLSGDSRCLVCLDNGSNAKQIAPLDAACQFSEQSYLTLVNIILSPVVFEQSTELLYLCKACQGLVDNFEHHQLQVKSIKDAMLLRYRNVHSSTEEVSGTADGECCDSPSTVVIPLEKDMTHSACPDWQDLGPPHHEKALRNETSGLKPSGKVCSVLSEQQKPSSQSRLWTVCDDGQTYQCTLCDKKFAHRTYMYTHVRIHTGARPHACTSCARSFRSSSALSEHERSAHSTGAQFSCELCGQTFVHASSLRQHLRRHRQQAAHRCADCGKTFHRAAHLREHAAVHSQRRPHACAVCGKTFKNRSGLVYHGRIHSGERPHQCAVCRARFRTSSNLARHVQTQHGGAAVAGAAAADTVTADRVDPPPPPPPPPATQPQPLPPATQPPLPPLPPQPPRFDLLQPAGFEVPGPDFGLAYHHHHHHHPAAAAARGLHGAASSFDRSLHELLPVPLEAYRPL